MDEKNALEDIQFIRKIINESKRSVIYSGKDYIFWGILVFIGMLATYIFVNVHFYFNYIWVWVVLIPIGWGYSLYNRARQKVKYPSTFVGKIISAVWGAAGVGMTLIGFVGTYSGTVSPNSIAPILCIIMGGAYFATGVAVESKWFRNLSFAWWIGGIVLLFVVSITGLLIMAFLMLAFQVIPGLIIYNKFKKEFVLSK